MNNTAVKFSNSHLLRIESQIHGDLKVKKKLTIYEQRNPHCVKSVQIRIQEYRNKGIYGPEITTYLDIFYAVIKTFSRLQKGAIKFSNETRSFEIGR